jgi:hypothetical protein
MYIPNNDHVVEIRIDLDVPTPVRTIPAGMSFDLFYGLFDNQILIQKDKKIMLGNKILVELSMSRRDTLITTDELIFVFASPTNLLVFDHKGHELARTDPKRSIRFGSISHEDPHVVYGVSGSKLLRICLDNGRLVIQEVGDLANFERICQL